VAKFSRRILISSPGGRISWRPCYYYSVSFPITSIRSMLLTKYLWLRSGGFLSVTTCRYPLYVVRPCYHYLSAMSNDVCFLVSLCCVVLSTPFRFALVRRMGRTFPARPMNDLVGQISIHDTQTCCCFLARIQRSNAMLPWPYRSLVRSAIGPWLDWVFGLLVYSDTNCTYDPFNPRVAVSKSDVDQHPRYF
jgi:hypothetical protein